MMPSAANRPSKPASSRASSIRGLGFTPGSQFVGGALVRVDLAEERRNPHAQDIRNSLERCDGYVLGATFDATDIGAVDTGLQRKPLLREALFDPQVTKVPADDEACVHGGHMSHIKGLTIDGLSVSYYSTSTRTGLPPR